MQAFYCEDACVTLQSMPYATDKAPSSIEVAPMNRKNRKEAIDCDSMRPYIVTSSNLLKGSWPIPSWVWAIENAETKVNLDRIQRKHMQSIREFQDINAKRIKKLIRRRNFTSISSVESSHSTPFFAKGSWEIDRLFAQIPTLVAVRDDSASHLDIVDHGVCTREFN